MGKITIDGDFYDFCEGCPFFDHRVSRHGVGSSFVTINSCENYQLCGYLLERIRNAACVGNVGGCING